MKKIKHTVPSKLILRDRENEAKFWEDNFDDAWKTGKPVKAKFAKNLSETINIRLDSNNCRNLRKICGDYCSGSSAKTG